MARGKPKTSTKRAGRSRSSGKGVGRWSLWLWVLAAVAAIILVGAIPGYRWWWHRAGSSELGRGLALMGSQGCTSCHRDAGGCWIWRTDGRMPASADAIRDAVLNGRPAVAGFPAGMPAYASRLQVGQWRQLVIAAGALSGVVGVPEDAELAAGRDIVVQMGCGSCHGVLGGGGIPNPGSLAGEVPGWYGPDFGRLLADDGALEATVREGGHQRRSLVPGVPPPLLNMPGYGGRLDSMELDLLVRYVEWLHDNPPALGPR